MGLFMLHQPNIANAEFVHEALTKPYQYALEALDEIEPRLRCHANVEAWFASDVASRISMEARHG